MNLTTKEKQTHRLPWWGEGESWTASLGLADANYYIGNG